MKLADNFHKQNKGWAMAEKKIQNEQIAIALNHLNLANEELQMCSNTLYTTLQNLEKEISNPILHEMLIKAITSLQMQDIITQRIEKLKSFLKALDEKISLSTDKSYLEEFAWENEVEQDDIDSMFNEYKG